MTGRQITAARRAYLIAQGLADGKSLTDAYLDTMPGEDEVISSILITSSNKKAPENAENQLFSGVFHHF